MALKPRLQGIHLVPSARRGRSPPPPDYQTAPPNRRKPKCTRCARACSWRSGPVAPGHRSTITRRETEMPRNQHGFKVVDGDNEEGSRKFRGPAINRVILIGRLARAPELHYTPS